MKRFSISLVILTAWLMAAASAQAAAPSWQFDPAHCSFSFDVTHIYATVRGHFTDYSGTFRFDPENLKDSSFDIKVMVNSVDTNNRKRDNHLLSGDFFDAGKYPEMSFVSSAIEPINEDQYRMTGNLTIKNVTRQISVPFTYFGSRVNPFNDQQLVAGFETRIAIDRLDYHVGTGKYYDMGVAGKDVTIIITLEMIRAK